LHRRCRRSHVDGAISSDLSVISSLTFIVGQPWTLCSPCSCISGQSVAPPLLSECDEILLRITSPRMHCRCGSPLPFNGGLAMTMVSQQKGFRHLQPDPCIVLHTTPGFIYIGVHTGGQGSTLSFNDRRENRDRTLSSDDHRVPVETRRCFPALT
jgi:hypothetical protein